MSTVSVRSSDEERKKTTTALRTSAARESYVRARDLTRSSAFDRVASREPAFLPSLICCFLDLIINVVEHTSRSVKLRRLSVIRAVSEVPSSYPERRRFTEISLNSKPASQFAIPPLAAVKSEPTTRILTWYSDYHMIWSLLQHSCNG